MPTIFLVGLTQIILKTQILCNIQRANISRNVNLGASLNKCYIIYIYIFFFSAVANHDIQPNLDHLDSLQTATNAGV